MSEAKPTRGIFEEISSSGIWWIRYTDASGRYRREKVGAYGLAKKLLDKRRGEAVTGKKLPETLRRKFVSLTEIADDALAYSEAHKRSYDDDCTRMKRLRNGSGIAEPNRSAVRKWKRGCQMWLAPRSGRRPRSTTTARF